MAVDLPPVLKSFVQVPYVIQAMGSPSDLMERASAAMASLGKPGATVSFGEGHAYRKAPGPLPTGAPADGVMASTGPEIGIAAGPVAEPMPRAEFHALIVGMQAKIDREIPKVEGYKIAIFDSAATDYSKEVTRVLGDRRANSGFSQLYRQFGGAGGFATPYSGSVKTETCLVVGMKPEVAMAVNILPGVVPFVGKASNSDFHVHLQWHEVGHCLLGGSEMHADTFGALMAVQSGAAKDTISTIANIREVDELMIDKVSDNHQTSQAVAWVARNFDRLKADPAFMKLDTMGMASFAKSVADRYAPDPEGLADASRVRRADHAFFGMRVHYAMTKDGIRPMGHMEYLRAHAAKVPLFARLVEMRTRIGDMTIPPSNFKVDVAALREQLGEIAKTGDPTAGAMLEALDAEAPTKKFSAPESMVLVERIEDGTKFASRFFAMDTDKVKVTFSHDQSAFATHDPETGHVVMTNAISGDRREMTREIEPVAFKR